MLLYQWQPVYCCAQCGMDYLHCASDNSNNVLLNLASAWVLFLLDQSLHCSSASAGSVLPLVLVHCCLRFGLRAKHAWIPPPSWQQCLGTGSCFHSVARCTLVSCQTRSLCPLPTFFSLNCANLILHLREWFLLGGKKMNVSICTPSFLHDGFMFTDNNLVRSNWESCSKKKTYPYIQTLNILSVLINFLFSIWTSKNIIIIHIHFNNMKLL